MTPDEPAEHERDSQRVGATRPGGRAARVRSSVLAATVELLEEVGYDDITFEDIASRAGVHRTTIYRRWPTKSELVADAVGMHSEERVPVPDTGTLRDDLAALAASVAANIGSARGARRVRSIVAATAASDELASIVHQFMGGRIALTEPIVERAIERGEISAGVDPTTVIESLVAPIWLRALVTGQPIDGTFLDTTVDFVIAAIRATLPTPPTS